MTEEQPVVPASFTQYLALTMLVGAASSDADPTQRAMLRERCIPPLRDETLTGQEARRVCCEAVLDIMGPEWAPTGEYADILAASLAPRLDEGPKR